MASRKLKTASVTHTNAVLDPTVWVSPLGSWNLFIKPGHLQGLLRASGAWGPEGCWEHMPTERYILRRGIRTEAKARTAFWGR